MTDLLRAAGAALYGAAWEARRRAYAAGLRTPRRVAARVVSVGNLTVGGTGKTTLVLHLAAAARARGLEPAVVCRRYRPGPAGEGDEERMFRAALGAGAVYAGASKRDLAAAAARAGRRLVLVDDGFSHWGLERDLDVVLLDARDPWEEGRLLPAGRLREPLRALQRAGVVVVTRLAPGEDAAPWLARAGRHAPAARLAAGRHAPDGVRWLAGGEVPAGARAWVLTATGNPAAVEATAREAGLAVVGRSTFRDHHWFSAGEARAARARAARAGAALVVTAKDAVRWPAAAGVEGVAVLAVRWAWVAGGEAAERAVFGEEAR